MPSFRDTTLEKNLPLIPHKLGAVLLTTVINNQIIHLHSYLCWINGESSAQYHLDFILNRLLHSLVATRTERKGDTSNHSVLIRIQSFWHQSILKQSRGTWPSNYLSPGDLDSTVMDHPHCHLRYSQHCYK